MIARINQNRASVTWHDRGISPSDPVTVEAAGLLITIQDEQEMRDLYECLHFLYGRGGAPRK